MPKQFRTDHETSITRVKTALWLFVGLAMLIFCPQSPAATPPKRIVSLAPNLTEILFDLGVKDRVVGVTDYCNTPPLAKAKPRIGGFANPSLEAIVALKPDLVVLTDDGNPREVADRLGRLGIRTYIFRGGHIKDLPNKIIQMGDVLGVPVRAGERAAALETDLRRIEDRGRQRRAQQIRTALFVIQPEPLIVAGKGTTLDDALNLLGLKNIAGDAPAQYPKFSLESLLTRNPEVIFIARGHTGVTARTRALLKRLPTLDAVRRGRVYEVSDAIFRPGPRIIGALQEMERHLQ